MPLTFDMPLDQLPNYQGTNPRPADFDAYWDVALAEMRAVKPEPEWKPAAFQSPTASCFDLFFTGVGGARIHAKVLQPRGQKGSHPAVLMFHGYANYSGEWAEKLPYVALGYTVAALDCRGQGGISEDAGGQPGMTWHGHIIRGIDGRPEDLAYRSIFLDTAELAAIIMDLPHVDPTRVGATGSSQGGGLTLACAALVPGIKQAAPISPFLCDYKRVWKIDQDTDAYGEIRDYLRMKDPRHQREDEFFTRLGYIDVQYLCPRIRAEVYMATGLRDKTCPPSTQFAAYNKITSPRRVELYPDFGHEVLRGHNDLIYQFMCNL